MNNPMRALFVYHKDGKIQVNELYDASGNLTFTPDGWKHTATLYPRSFIEHLANLSDEEILKEIHDLKKSPNDR